MRISKPVRLSTCVALIILSGCAFGEFRPDDPFSRQMSLEDQHKAYTDFVRWSKFEEASSFVHVEERNEFLAEMPEFDEVRITDWDAKPWEFEDPELKNKAVIKVTYRGYSMRTPFETQFTEVQTWERDGRANRWSVRPEFENLDRLAGR